eukprot:7121_1
MAWYYSCIPWISLCLITSLIMSIHLTYQLFLSNSKSKVRTLYRRITFISCIFCTFCIIADLIHVTHAFIDNGIIISHKYDHALVTATAFYYVGTVTLYILLMSRLYFTFQNTMYSLSNSLTIFIGLLISISALCGVYYCIIIASITDEYKVITFNRPATIILEINDFILNSVLLILFVYKLKRFIADSYDYNNTMELLINDSEESIHSRNNTKSLSSIHRDQVKLEPHQNKFVRVITRNSLLGSLAIIANQLFWIGYMYDVYIVRDITVNLYPSIVYSMRSCENMINVMVLYLSLTINDKMYFKLCNSCHKACYQCNVKQSQRTIIKQMTTKRMNSVL